MESLTSVESVIQAGLVAATLGLALRGIAAQRRDHAGTRTGEAAWSMVAVAIVVLVAAAAGLGGAHGF